MRKSNWTPSIVPRGDEHDVYLVVDDLGRLGWIWRQAEYGTNFEIVIRDLLEGQYKNPVGIFCLCSAQGRSRDASGEIARELRLQLRDVPLSIRYFVERHEGQPQPTFKPRLAAERPSSGGDHKR